MRRTTTRGATGGFRVSVAALVVALAASLVLLADEPAGATATFVVNSTGDENDLDFPSGAFDGSSDLACDVNTFVAGDQCTLRAAIQEANLTTDQDTINFDIPGTGVKTIGVGATGNGRLPDILQPLTIDGYTQPGSKENDLAVGTNAILRVQIAHGGTGGVTGLRVGAPGSVIRGLVINRFPTHGILAFGGVVLEGNFIGTDPSGTRRLGQQAGGGVALTGDNNEVGQVSRASRNLISGNGGSGIAVFGTHSNLVANNLIGTARDGKSPIGNSGSGVQVSGGSSNCAVGIDEGPGYPNTIAFNGGDGVEVEDGSSKVALASNSIFSNAGLGIDLLGPGENNSTDVTLTNDSGDADTGANGLQNFPVLTSAASSRNTTVKGTLDSTASTAFVVHLFSNPEGANEGKTYLGQKQVVSNSTGHVDFTLAVDQRLAAGRAITATATNLTGDTSEFSAPLAVNGPPEITPISPRPGSRIHDRTPRIRAAVSDSTTVLTKGDIRLLVDGHARSFSYDSGIDRLVRSSSRLALGRHAVRIAATDAQGLKSTKTWRFRVTL